MGKTAFLFSGQGAQRAGMGKEFYEHFASVRALFDAAEELRPGTLQQMFAGSDDELRQTENTQPCLYLADLAAAYALRDSGLQPEAVAGFSLGEVAAVTFAGIFTAEEGFSFVTKRGEAMQAAAEKVDSAMAAVLKLANDKVEELCRMHQSVFPVNYNCPGQLVIGGVTPSPAMLEQVLRDCPVPVNVLIRPRFGDFLYTDAEMDQMCREIDLFRRLGVNGVVIGALTPDGALDMEKMRRMIDCAGDMEVTLHRAFDMSRDPFRTLEDAVSLGCRTVLTSGQAPDAAAGIPLLARLRRQAAGRIHIMAGCGVKWWNIQQIHHETGIRTFHTTGRRAPLDSGMTYRKSTVSMGLPTLSEYEVWQTDPEEFARCAAIVHGLHETSI